MSEPKILYSSDGSHLKTCPKCGKNPCRCPKSSALDPKDHTIKVRRETAGRGGKVVTAVFELPQNEAYFKDLTARLKSHCGCGGAYKDNRIEIQGDHRDKVKSYLEKLGFSVKLAGG